MEHVYLLLLETRLSFGQSTDVDRQGLKKYLDFSL